MGEAQVGTPLIELSGGHGRRRHESHAATLHESQNRRLTAAHHASCLPLHHRGFEGRPVSVGKREVVDLGVEVVASKAVGVFE